MLTSKDAGHTWSNATYITAQATVKTWSWIATGPPQGLQLPSGRLLISADHIIGGKKKSLFSMLVWSMEFIKNFKEDKPVHVRKVGLNSDLFYKDVTA